MSLPSSFGLVRTPSSTRSPAEDQNPERERGSGHPTRTDTTTGLACRPEISAIVRPARRFAPGSDLRNWFVRQDAVRATNKPRRTEPGAKRRAGHPTRTDTTQASPVSPRSVHEAGCRFSDRLLDRRDLDAKPFR